MTTEIEPEVTYSIEGYSTKAPVELQTYSKCWGGFLDPESAERYARNYESSPQKFRIVKVTREVVKEL